MLVYQRVTITSKRSFFCVDYQRLTMFQNFGTDWGWENQQQHTLKKTWFVRSTHHKRMRPNLTARQSVGAGNDTRPPWVWSVSLTETQVDIYSCSDGFLYYLIDLIVLGTYFCSFRNCASLFGNIAIRHDTGVFNQKSAGTFSMFQRTMSDVVYPDVFHRWRSIYAIYGYVWK